MFMRGRPITMFIPSDVENYDEVRTELPAERLKLEWVYPSTAVVGKLSNWWGCKSSSRWKECLGEQVCP